MRLAGNYSRVQEDNGVRELTALENVFGYERGRGRISMSLDHTSFAQFEPTVGAAECALRCRSIVFLYESICPISYRLRVCGSPRPFLSEGYGAWNQLGLFSEFLPLP